MEKEELPILWAVAGSTRQVGRTTLAAALGGLLASKEFAVELIRPDFFFNQIDRDRGHQRLCAAEMHPVFQRLDKEFTSSLNLIYDKLSAQEPDRLKTDRQQIFLDLNASLSHYTLDLFLAADIKMVVIDPTKKAQQELDVFLNACFLRWLELTLHEHDDSLHELFSSLKQRRKLHDVSYLDFFDSNKLRQAISPVTIHIILNKAQKNTDFVPLWMEKHKHGLYAGTQFTGQLFFDKQSVNLLSVIHIFFNHLFHHDRLDLFRCIEQKMMQMRSNTGSLDQSHLAISEPLNTWPYTVVDGQIVLNLNPAEFDASTTESHFSALDSDLFE